MFVLIYLTPKSKEVSLIASKHQIFVFKTFETRYIMFTTTEFIHNLKDFYKQTIYHIKTIINIFKP